MTADDGIRIGLAETPEDVAAVADLFRAYAASLDVDLAYQGFSAELAGLPGKYSAADGGALLLARKSDGVAAGCVALRRLDGTQAPVCASLRRAEGARRIASRVCEMKRLYVPPEGRGHGLGRRLITAVTDEARRLGYAEIRLDSLPSMTAAITLYRAMGFEQIAAYYVTPVVGTVFLGLRLG